MIQANSRSSSSVAIIGAGPGGLAAAVLMQAQGHDVEVFEKSAEVGGRNAALKLGDFTFDTGPTFFLMPGILEEIFEKCGKSLSDYLQLTRIDPLYKLVFGDGTSIMVKGDTQEMIKELEKINSADSLRLVAFKKHQKKKFEAILPALRQPLFRLKDFLSLKNIAALNYLNLRSVYDELSQYFQDERTRLIFTFQAKYLGMSPFDAPSLFTILPHIEHDLGVWYPTGGCHQITLALAKLFTDLGGKIHLSTPIEKLEVQEGRFRALRLANGYERRFDFGVLNADFAYAMHGLVNEADRRSWNNHKIARSKFSCSTFMIYIGLSKVFDLPHHSIYFSGDYRKNIDEISNNLGLSADPSFYVHNPSAMDSNMAPAGKSAVYILVPVANLNAAIDWSDAAGPFRTLVFDKIQERCGVDLRAYIEVEKVITPKDWESEFNVHKGATFSLAHSFDQMMKFRPHNEFEDIANLFLVGGGTHPGSGLPTIFESARIAAQLLQERVEAQKSDSLTQSIFRAARAFESSAMRALPFEQISSALTPALNFKKKISLAIRSNLGILKKRQNVFETSSKALNRSDSGLG